MTDKERTLCGVLCDKDAGRRVFLTGWVDALRDHGDVLFIHLRDRSGIVQVVFDPRHTPETVIKRADSLRVEFCLSVTGQVVRRGQGTENPHILTGTVEVAADELVILNISKPIPFTISEKAMVAGAPAAPAEAVTEDMRLAYRYLDLRRPSMQENLMFRHRVFGRARAVLDDLGFLEIETPVLTKSTPEGARDYLVPSRIYPRRFFALPQSPQLFKQLLMVGGLERYYQFARCFRDEDLRPNRQPEFTQLDMEASFIDESFIRDTVEALVQAMFGEKGIELKRPFPRMTWHEAMDRMGTDRPDTRFDMQFVEASDIFSDTAYGIFREVLRGGGHIKGINVKGQAGNLSKNVLQNEYAKVIVPSFGAAGMTWMKIAGGAPESNIVHFFSDGERAALMERFNAADGDVIIMIADTSYKIVVGALGQLRLHLADRLGLIPSGVYRPLWVTDFPLFTRSRGKLTSNHHPFTAPDRDDFDPGDEADLLSLRSRSYDLVVNGEELGGGSMRIHDARLQRAVFRCLGLPEDEVEERFGFFLRALEYGAPPHGGIALGMDRVVSMILGTDSIREVIAFPKNRKAFCPLSEAPSPVSRRQLSDLGLLDLDAGGWVDGRKMMGG